MIVPVMWEHFTDTELRAMRIQFYTSIPVPRLEAWMRWSLPAFNLNELVVFFRGMKEQAPADLLRELTRMAGEYVDPVRWESARKQVGLSGRPRS